MMIFTKALDLDSEYKEAVINIKEASKALFKKEWHDLLKLEQYAEILDKKSSILNDNITKCHKLF